MRRFYKVQLLSIDYDETLEKVKSVKEGIMIDILDSVELKEVKEVIVYKTIFGKFKEIITGMEVPAMVEELAPYSNAEHEYYMTKNMPLFFKCNLSSEKDPERDFDYLDDMEASADEFIEYVDYNVNREDAFIDEMTSLESDAIMKFDSILRNYGLVRKKINRSERKKIKSIAKHYDI